MSLLLQPTSEKINSISGLTNVGLLLQRLPFLNASSNHKGQSSDADIIRCMIGLQVQGRCHYEDIEAYREDSCFKDALNIGHVASSSRLNQRFQDLAFGDKVWPLLYSANLSLLRSQRIGSITVGNDRFIPHDIDVSPFDNGGSRREGVSRTYKGCDGFSPIFSYLGSEGWLLNHELRPGKQHCQKDTPAFLAQCFEQIETLQLPYPVLSRLDSGNDSQDTLACLRKSNGHFIVKRNIRRENKEQWLETAKLLGEATIPRKGKEVYTGTINHLIPGGEKSDQTPLPVVYRVVCRTIDKKGQRLLIPEVEVETYWTNLWHEPQDIIECYHNHGTCEQFHSELKTDLSLERLPSYSFATNQLFLLTGQIAYNLLRAIGQCASQAREVWPKRIKNVSRRRLASIIKDLILVGGKLVSHAGKVTLKISKHSVWARTLLAVQCQLTS